MYVLINAWRDTVHPLAGGSEVMVDHLAGGLTEAGHRVVLRAGAPVAAHVYPTVNGGGKFTQYLTAPISYHRHFRDADLVVDVANGMTYYSPLWTSRPVVCLVHHLHTTMWRQWFPAPVAMFGREMERRAMPKAYRNSLFVAVSDSTADALQAVGVPGEHIRVVPNGVDLPLDASPPKSETPTFVSLGRLVPHKRYDRLLRLWPRVRAAVGGQLVVIGEGPERPALERLVGSTAGVEFVGRVDEREKHRLLSDAWLLVHPSEVEGWGLVVMEAAGHATPTLGYRVPGIRDSVVDGVTGLLADDDEAFVAHWISLARDHTLRGRLSAGARRRAETHAWSRTVSLFEGVAMEALERGRRAEDRDRSK